MSLNHAWMLKGWLLAEHAPAAIIDAVNSVIESFSTSAPKQSIDRFTATKQLKNGDIVSIDRVPMVVRDFETTSIEMEATGANQPGEKTQNEPKKSRQWSPEAREAAAKRMRDRQAAGLMKRKNPNPGEA